jgi:pimeloyl-ACP methyl ester carboxylesterase
MMTGTYDYLTTPEMTRATAEQIKGAEFIEMQDIGHFPMSENYPVFKGYLEQALDRIEERIGTTVSARR